LFINLRSTNMKKINIVIIFLFITSKIFCQTLYENENYYIESIDTLKNCYIIKAHKESSNKIIKIVSEKKTVIIKSHKTKIETGKYYFIKTERADLNLIQVDYLIIRIKDIVLWNSRNDNIDSNPYFAKNLKGLYLIK